MEGKTELLMDSNGFIVECPECKGNCVVKYTKDGRHTCMCLDCGIVLGEGTEKGSIQVGYAEYLRYGVFPGNLEDG